MDIRKETTAIIFGYFFEITLLSILVAEIYFITRMHKFYELKFDKIKNFSYEEIQNNIAGNFLMWVFFTYSTVFVAPIILHAKYSSTNFKPKDYWFMLYFIVFVLLTYSTIISFEIQKQFLLKNHYYIKNK